MQITFEFEDNATPTTIAERLRMRAGIFEGLTSKEAASKKNTKAPAVTKEAEESLEETEKELAADDDDFSPKKDAKKSAAAAFDDDDVQLDAEVADDDEDDFKAPAAAKKAPAKKLTLDDVNDACKARAKRTGGPEGRKEVLALLKKHFKASSVSELKPEQFAKAIEVMD